MRKRLIGMLLCGLLAAGVVSAKPAQKAPWWKEQKIVFMWGQWPHARVDKNGDWWKADLPRELFRNLGQAGATVFTETRGYKPNHARYAHEFGLKYFATRFVIDLQDAGKEVPGARKGITKTGELNEVAVNWRASWCPLDETVYEKWIVEPHLKGAREGLIDGMHVDWEGYGGGGEMEGICYCDDCFSRFLALKSIKTNLPEKPKRFTFLEDQQLVKAYEDSFHKRRVKMFESLRQKLQTANPEFLFSSYGTVFSDFTRAVNTPDRPFIFLDARHYYNDDRQPWWESYGDRLRKEGYLYIPGGWANALFGAQASQVSAARWIYEASVNEDGCWLWFERELDDEILRAYAAASREIRGVEAKVGKFFFQGKRDPNFVTAVEWTGRPDLQQAAITRAYHLGKEHLIHVNNVHTEWPMRVRLRLPRLPEDGRWSVRDAMSGLYYAHDGETAVWTGAQLRAGVVVAMEPRSDLFLQVAPAGRKLKVEASQLVASAEFGVLPGHEAASAKAGPVKTMVSLYVKKNALYGEKLDTLLGSTEQLADLPTDGWRFKGDKDDIGAGGGWYLPQSSMEGWTATQIGKFWGAEGGTGAHWYRGDIEIAALPADRHIYLHFGAVDEELVLWLDGTYAGDYQHPGGPDEGWDKPFAIDVTGKLTPGKHHLALRVHNVGAAGGVWKPISLLAGSAVGDEAFSAMAQKHSRTSGRLLYTATEPMGFEGAEGGLTIGNAIRTVNADGESQVRIRQLRGHLWSPSYSPDGKRIAFVHDSGGRGQIYVMNQDGSDAVNISSNASCDRSPAWSSDGDQIALVSDRSGDWDIWVMNADGTGQRRLAGNPGLDRAPVWSPDGKRIAWESHTSGTPAVWTVESDGGNSRPLVSATRPLKIGQGQIGKDNVFNFAAVDWPFKDNTVYLTDPVWSPDSKRIAAQCLGAYSGDSFVVLDAEGSRMLQIIGWIGGIDKVVWSPDGSHLAGTLRTAPQETERSGIFVVKADGTSEYKWLVDVTPQGPRLGGARRYGLMTWYSHGSAQPRRVVKTFESLCWSPDGKSLAFSSDMDPSGAFYVYTVPLDGGKPTRLDATQSAWPNEIIWKK